MKKLDIHHLVFSAVILAAVMWGGFALYMTLNY